MDLPRISVVTPSFNQAEFLEACIDSVLSQNYPNLEYILMDGGSTDGSVKIIKKYERFLTYWQSGPDGGQYQAIHDGFRKTTGEIMAWLNSDDKYHHLALFKVGYIFTVHKNVEWITGRPTIWNPDGSIEHVLFEFLPTYSRGQYLRAKPGDNMLQQESTFWRRALWERAGGRIRADLSFAGDFELWIRFFRYARIFTVDTLLGGYRRHEKQKMAQHPERYFAEVQGIIEQEMAVMKQGEHSDLWPAPPTLSVSSRDLKSYVDSAFRDRKAAVYKISDETEAVLEFLIRKLLHERECLRRMLEEKAGGAQLSADEILELLAARSALDEIQNSLSWRATAPVRHLLDRFKRALGRA